MPTILPPPDKKNFKSEKEFKEAYKKWKYSFNKAMKEFTAGSDKI